MSPSPARILIASGNAELREHFRRLLSVSYTVDLAVDGKAAWSTLRTRRPDLVLAHEILPRMGARALLGAIRDDPELHTLPVILVSGGAADDSNEDRGEGAADDFLVVPCSARELLARVAAQLKIVRLRHEVAAQAEKLRATQRHAKALSELSEQIAAVTDADEIIVVATRFVGLHLNAHRCYFAEVDVSGGQVTVRHDWRRGDSPTLRGAYRLDEFGTPEWRRVVSSRKIAVSDTGTHVLTRDFAANYEALQVRAYATAPFTRETTWVAALAVTQSEARVWTEDELNFLENAVARVWPAFERARAAAELRESRAAERARRIELEAIMNAAPAAIWIAKDRECRTIVGNPAGAAMLRLRPADNLSKSSPEASTRHFELFDNGRKLPPDELPMQQAAREGRPVLKRELELRFDDGSAIWEYGNAVPLHDEQGAVSGAVAVFVDVTDRKQIELALRARTTLLESLNRAAIALSEDRELEVIVQRVTDAATELSGAAFGAFFYNVRNEAGDAYTLYALSGAPREAFSKFPMPRNTDLFSPTFSGEGIVRLGDVRKDPRFGRNAPHHGMPKGHLSVVSYLAVPVKTRTGEVLGGLFFGHPKPDVFTAEGETAVATLAAQAAIAIDNAGLYRGLQRELARAKEGEASSRKLAAIVESSDDAIISKDLNGIIMSWNAGAQRLFGYTAEEIIGKPVLTLIPRDRHDEEPVILAKLRRGERIDHYETIRQHKDGSLLDISLTVSPIRDETGKVVGASKIARDVTARRRADAQQRALYEMLVTVNRAAAMTEIYDAAINALLRCLRSDRASILLLDEANVMRFVAWRGISDDYRRAVEGHSPWAPDARDAVPITIEDVARASLEPGLAEVVRREGIRAMAFFPLTYENRLRGKLMLYYNTPQRFDSGELRVAEAIASQIAFAVERQRGAQALEAMVADRTQSLRQAIAQMEEFSYSVSHDLRSPVRAMRGYAEAVLQDYGDRLDEDGRELLARIHRSGMRMDRLIQDLLTYSRVSRREIHLEPVSLTRLIREVVQQYPEMRPDYATIEVPATMPDVLAHEPSMTQVISNLLSNAVKFVPQDVRPHVTIGWEQRGDRVRVWFKDNGIGVPPEYQSRLFGMFERMHPEGRYEGTGIGLAIVRKAVERMNGKVGMESDGVTGSRFWIELGAAFP